MPQGKLLIFDTHPIQYRSPVFRALYRKWPLLSVHFFNETFDGSRWWFHEVGKIPKQKFGLPLREGFPNQIVGTAGLGLRGTWRAFKDLIVRERPSAIVVYGYYLPEHWLLRRLSAHYRVPLIFIGETFSMGASPFRRLIKAPLQRYFFRGISQFITIGSRTEGFYKSFGIEQTRITPAKYCTDVSFFALEPEEAKKARDTWRSKLGIPEDAFVLLFVGRLFERKRPHDMVELHRRLARTSKVHTVIVGNGPLEEELRQHAKGVDTIHFPGFQDQAQTRDAYYGADLLVVPSEYETWGLVVNEAFACRLPAIVTSTCGTAGDLVVESRTGFVYPVGDIDAAEAKVRALLDDASLRGRMREEARRKVAAEYSVEQFADAFLEALDRVTGKSAKQLPREARA